MEHIVVNDLSFAYSEECVVKNVSFKIEKGKYTTIIGHNGSGKSTIAKLIMGLLEKKSGEIIIDGLPLNLNNLNQIRNKIGIVFQNPDNQFIGSTVRDDIAFGLENHCYDPNDMDEIILEYAKKVNMLDFLDSEPSKLSGGQKQRVAIAGVLAMNPDIIILDESTSMLDPQGKDEINNLIFDLHKKNALTIISITHDIEEVAKSDYVIVMDNGKVLMEGIPSEVLMQEEKLLACNLDIPFSYKFVNELNKLDIKVDKSLSLEGVVENLCQLALKK